MSEKLKKREKRILTAGPSITQKEIDYVNHAVRNGWNEHWHDYIDRFEENFAKYIGVKHAVATSSCTGALHLAVVALGLKEGDEVILPEISWVSTANVLTYIGIKPVFVDIQKDTWNIDPIQIEKAITPKTKAIMPVHIYGHPCDMEKIMNIAKQHNLIIIEDVAEALGATFQGKKAGSWGNTAAFSFQGAKTLSTGEGGMLVTNDERLAEKVMDLNDYGRDRGFFVRFIAYKYRISNLQAAMGCAQLERIEELVEKKRKIFNWYKERLQNIEGLKMNTELSGYRNTYWMTTIVLDRDFGITRDKLRQKLLDDWNIDTRTVFFPMSHFIMFETLNNPVAEWFSRGGINLPSGHNLTEDDIDYICSAIRIILKV